jgi:hypothetical protein
MAGKVRDATDHKLAAARDTRGHKGKSGRDDDRQNA